MNISPYRRATSWQELGKLAPHVAAGRGQTEPASPRSRASSSSDRSTAKR
jgi:hypothetical protein